MIAHNALWFASGFCTGLLVAYLTACGIIWWKWRGLMKGKQQ